MALSAGVEIEIRTTGNDANGGGFNTAASGTDRSQQDSPQATLTTAATVHTTTTQINVPSGEFTVSAADVGNLFQVSSGTATAGFYEITAVDVPNNRWTVDRAVGTAAQTCGGRMGGGLASIGKAGSIPYVAGNKFWVKYDASNAYASTTTTNAVSNGRIALGTAGTALAPVLFRGYDAAHGDSTGNRPTIQWGTNAASIGILGVSAAWISIENLIFDGNRANFTSTRGVNLTTTPVRISGCKFTGFSASAIVMSGTLSAVHVTGCEVTDCASAAAVSVAAGGSIVVERCYFHDNAITALSCTAASTRVTLTGCVFDTATGTSTLLAFGGSATSSQLIAHQCNFYGADSHGVSIGVQMYAHFAGCIFQENGGWGIDTPTAGSHPFVYFENCAFYANTSGNYDTSKVPSSNVVGSVSGSGSFFTNAASADFSLNTTAGAGASARAAGYPPSLPGLATVNKRDVGVLQHADPAGGGGLLLNSGMTGGMRG